jgi:branched-chain amino acid transport system substrate-binding protein
MHKMAQFAVQNKNDDGGLLDREIELIDPDPQSDTQRYQSLARRLINEDNVDVLQGVISGASREAVLPIVAENKQLYFYNAGYAGGMCNEYAYSTATVPQHQLGQLIRHMTETHGPKVYTLAADYTYGQVQALWGRRYMEEAGAELVGEEFLPLSVSDFTSTINNIQDEDPDWVLSILVGNNHNSYFKQAPSAGVDKPIGTAVQIGGSYEHKTMEPPLLEGMVASFNYFEELDNQRNEEFVNAFYEMFPDATYINQHAYCHWLGYQFYFNAVEQAGTTEDAEVNKALESGDISIEAPEGTISMIPEIHHVNHANHLAEVQDDHSLEFVGSTESVKPEFLMSKCNLTQDSNWENGHTERYLPEE